jgi:hypothetical protein
VAKNTCNKFQFFFLFTAVFIFTSALSQNTATLYGFIEDDSGVALQDAVVAILGSTQKPVYADVDGKYSIIIPSNTDVIVVFSSMSHQPIQYKVNLQQGERKEFSPRLRFNNQLSEITINADKRRFQQVTHIDPILVSKLPSASQDFNAILFTLPGVSNRNELSSAYSVRGGNFDENLVYVNGIEVYRPFLIRAGQQEGLSFVNPDMVSSVLFSAGGFESKYGDKMASVLDVQYRRPRKFNGTAGASFLGSTIHLEGASPNYRFTWIVGARYKNNQYLLKSLNTQGAYKPFFGDIQSFLTYNVSNRFELQFLGNISANRYQVIPQNRETSFGTINEALKLKLYFDGQEVDQFNTQMGALSGVYKDYNDRLVLRFIASVFNTRESEAFDIQGQYFLSKLETDFTSKTFGDSVQNIGVGTYLNHARTNLNAQVYSAEHKGSLGKQSKQLLWGVKYSHEQVNDNLREWTYIDSAGYSLPLTDPQQIVLNDVIKQKIKISSNRVSSYVQGIWNKELKDTSELFLTAGLRANYWDFNNQTVVGPRASVGYKPYWKRDFLFKFATGYYYQPPFYRELRDLQGNINYNLKAQTSIHFVLSSDYNFKAWNRPFKLITEAYYKILDNIIPYQVDNVRIRYSAVNNAKGYVQGIDLKINGEFIKDLESWASVSFMQTQEDIKGDYYYEYYNSDGQKIIPGYTANNVATDSTMFTPGYIPRPTDQRINFGLFFQDKMPLIPNLKMHLNMIFGTGVPFGAPGSQRYQQVLRMPSYRRVDVGFSYQLMSEQQIAERKSTGKFIKSVWLSLEVFNLLDTDNTVSYIWVSDVTNRQYAVPNYLTNRQLNLRTIIKF